MEFIIRRVDDGYFDLPSDLFSEVMHPNSLNFDVIQGWGNHRIKVQGCEISFSDEIAGIQVAFECSNFPIEQAEILIKEVCENIEKITGQPAEYIQTD